MAQKGITLYTKTEDAAHITAADDAAIYRAIFGSTSASPRQTTNWPARGISDTLSLATGVFSNQGFLLAGGLTLPITLDG